MPHPQNWRRSILILGAVFATTLFLAGNGRGASLDKLDCSLKLIPADAAFYTASLRNKEQLDIVLNSKAFAKIKALPAVQMLQKMIQDELGKNKDRGLAEFRAIMNDPQNQQLVELLGDMVSQEFFLMGDRNFGDFLELWQKLNTSNYTAMMSMISPENRGKDVNELQIKTLLRALSEHSKLVHPPDFIIGFRISDAKRAQNQIQRLEQLLAPLVAREPKLKGRLKTVKVDGNDFLSFSIDGSLVPWDQIPMGRIEETPGEYDQLVKKLKEVTFTVSLGIRDRYLLLAIGSGTECLSKLGKGKSLADLPEFEPLVKHADKRIIEVSYVSQRFRAQIGTTKKDVDGLFTSLQKGLKDADLPDKVRKRIDKDIDELSKDIKSAIPEIGAMMSFGFMTGRGQESFSYDWSESLSADGSKPLSLLEHVGGSPLATWVGRTHYNPQTYATVVKWLKTANGYFEDYVVPRLDENQKELYDKYTKLAYPLLKRFDETTSKMWIPSLADGQGAFVLDAKWKSKKWFEGMPPSEKPMPMFEIAVVLGISDQQLLQKAMSEYRGILNDTIGIVIEQTGAPVGAFSIPGPESKKLKSGTMFYYSLPPILPIDRQILPNVGLSDKVAVLTFSQDHSERILDKHPLKVGEGLLANVNRPLAGAEFLDWAGIIDALTPWVEYSLNEALPKSGKDAVKNKDDVLKQVQVGLGVLKTIRNLQGITYVEGKAMVRHSEVILHDQ